MLNKVKNYFFEEEAEASFSDIAVLVVMTLALAFAAYALFTVGVN